MYPLVRRIKKIYKMVAPEESKTVLSNFTSLSVVQAVTYILPVIILPYLFRVIGPGKFGLIAFAQAFVQYFMILTDYGFNVSATKEISLCRDNPSSQNLRNAISVLPIREDYAYRADYFALKSEERIFLGGRRRKMMKKIVGAGLSLIFAVTLSGCALLFGAAAGGAGTAFWLSGKLSSQVGAPYERTIHSAKQALSSLKMEALKETHSDEVTQIKSKYSDGREVWIDIRPLSENATKVEIRVGARGDKAASSRILERIKKYL